MGLNANLKIHKNATAFCCIFLCVFYFPGINFYLNLKKPRYKHTKTSCTLH